MDFEQRVGTAFNQKPPISLVADFLNFVERTGLPQDWPPLTTAKHPAGLAPKILCSFGIPERLRAGLDSRTPCSICCDKHPKFYEGYLTYLPDDGLVRIIGNKCGLKYFDEGSFLDQVREFKALEKEVYARVSLEQSQSDFSAVLEHCNVAGETLRSLILLRRKISESVGNPQINEALKSRVGEQLVHHVITERENSTGHLWEKQTVAVVPGIEAFSHSLSFIQDMYAVKGTFERAVATVLSGGSVAALPRNDAIDGALALTKLRRLTETAETAISDLRRLFSPTACDALTVWGQHPETRNKFWIKHTNLGYLVGHGQQKRPSANPILVEVDGDEVLALAA